MVVSQIFVYFNQYATLHRVAINTLVEAGMGIKKHQWF
jgi:hypothetical protein